MSKIPELRETPDLPDEVKQAAIGGQLVLFVGAGVSRLVGIPSWAGLAEAALDDLRMSGQLNYSELEQLKNLDPKKQLSIAKLLAEENGVGLDLTRHLTANTPHKRVYEYLNSIGCACVTTNYDELLSPTFIPTKSGSTAPSTVKRISNREQFYAYHLDSPGSVVHLHGSISDPKTMVVTTKDYLEHYDAEEVQHFLGELFEKKNVLFIGYGLEEAEILEHILRRGQAGKTSNWQMKRRFTLQGFFLSQKPLYEKLHGYYLKSFGVHLIGFVRDFRDHEQLETIIKDWAEKIEVRPPGLSGQLDLMEEVLNGS